MKQPPNAFLALEKENQIKKTQERERLLKKEINLRAQVFAVYLQLVNAFEPYDDVVINSKHIQLKFLEEIKTIDIYMDSLNVVDVSVEVVYRPSCNCLYKEEVCNHEDDAFPQLKIINNFGKYYHIVVDSLKDENVVAQFFNKLSKDF